LLTKRSAVTHDEDVAEAACGLEVSDMAEMQKVECPMGMDHRLAGEAELLGDGRKLSDGAHLLARHRRGGSPRGAIQGDYIRVHDLIL
jgi:hypothetical protein